MCLQPAQFKGCQPFRLWFGTSSFSFSCKQTHANTLSKREGQRAESDRLASPGLVVALCLCPPGLCSQVLCQASIVWEKSHRVVCGQECAPCEHGEGPSGKEQRAFPSGGHCGQEGVSTQADHQVPGLCPWKSCRHVWGWDLGPSGEK